MNRLILGLIVAGLIGGSFGCSRESQRGGVQVVIPAATGVTVKVVDESTLAAAVESAAAKTRLSGEIPPSAYGDFIAALAQAKSFAPTSDAAGSKVALPGLQPQQFIVGQTAAARLSTAEPPLGTRA